MSAEQELMDLRWKLDWDEYDAVFEKLNPDKVFK